MGSYLEPKIVKSNKIIFPFKIEIDSMERLIVISLKGDPEYDMIEPQVFNDPINGKGMRIILYRKDQKVDIYWQPGVKINRETITIGAGIGHFMETAIQPSKFEITEFGVDLHVEFFDAEGKKIELKILENLPKSKSFPFLAPVGKDIYDPKRLFFAHMLEFDFVRKTGTEFYGKIGDRSLYPESFPILRNFKKSMFIRYAGFPVVGTFNPPMKEPLTFNLEEPGFVEVEGMVLNLDENFNILQACVNQNKKKVVLDFPGGFPNLNNLKDGSEIKGEWIYYIADMEITGGSYFLSRLSDHVEIEINVLKFWKPVKMPLSFKLFTWFVKSFRNWPTTYVWTGIVNLKDNTLNSSWKRNNTMLKN